MSIIHITAPHSLSAARFGSPASLPRSARSLFRGLSTASAYESDDGAVSTGTWEATPGVFARAVVDAEFSHFIAGRATFVTADGQQFEIPRRRRGLFPAAHARCVDDSRDSCARVLRLALRAATAMDAATLFILVSMVIDAMGFGLILPVAPRLIMELTGTDLAGAASTAGYLMVAYAAMQFVFAPIVGAVSDHFGRRPVLLGSMAALTLDYLLMGVSPAIGWLFLGRIVAGIAGATYPTANAVISDVHPEQNRARFFGLIGAAWGVGFIAGPALGGLLAHFRRERRSLLQRRSPAPICCWDFWSFRKRWSWS